MTRKQALADLIAKVEVCKDNSELWRPALGDRGYHAMRAFHGSLDAAKALHEAVLPGWVVHYFSQNSRSMGWNMLLVSECGIYSSSHQGARVGFCDNPARVWLLAILRVLHSMEPET